jgi:D-alanyl-D-alanine carboxypeptidase (penicillin-binding protein 5/6)
LLAAEAIEAGRVSLYDSVTASENCTFDLTPDSSTAHISPGEVMTLQDLLYCALVASANEACNIIAEFLSGSIPAFVEGMNARAAELGCSGRISRIPMACRTKTTTPQPKISA